MKILLTGATGLLGSHLLMSGLEGGVELRVISREPLPRRSYLATCPESSRLEKVALDLVSGPIPEALFDGVDAVIHAAGLASADPSRGDEMMAINFDATRRLFEAAKAAGIKRWVQVSSTAVLGAGSSDSTGSGSSLLDESSLATRRPTAYADSKHAADEWIRAHSGSMQVLTIYPGYMLGSWDSKPSSGSILFALKMGAFKRYIEGQKSIVAAQDVASGIWQALRAGSEGQYILSGENLLISEFLRLACEKLGVDFDSLKAISEQELGQSSSVDTNFVREFCLSGGASSRKAARDFGYEPRLSAEQALDQALEWFAQARMLRPRKSGSA